MTSFQYREFSLSFYCTSTYKIPPFLSSLFSDSGNNHFSLRTSYRFLYFLLPSANCRLTLSTALFIPFLFAYSVFVVVYPQRSCSSHIKVSLLLSFIIISLHTTQLLGSLFSLFFKPASEVSRMV